MKTRSRPKVKLTKLVEIAPDMYPDPFFVTRLENPKN